MMDWSRNFLVIAIAVCGWFLIVQWQQDYSRDSVLLSQSQQVSQSQQILSPNQTPIRAGSNRNSSEVDFPPAAERVNSLEDLPGIDPSVLTNDSGETALSSPAELGGTQAGNAQKLVKVVTDVFELYIDPYGGDIVKVGLLGYPISLEHPDVPFHLFQAIPGKKYIAESGMVGLTGTDLDHGNRERPRYQVSDWEYQLNAGDTGLTVPFLYRNEAGIEFVKTYHLSRGSYEIKIDFSIDNQTEKEWLGRSYGRIIRNGYEDPTSGSGFGMQTFLGGAYLDLENKFKKIDFDDIDDAISENRLALKQDMQGGWIAMLQHYFLTAFVPDEDRMNTYKMFSRKGFDNYSEYILEVAQPVTKVPAKSRANVAVKLYAGPKIQEELKKIATGLNLAVDYGFLFFISDALFFTLSFLNSFLGNWGWSIIILTMIIKVFLYPLSAKSYRSMAQMRKVQPKLMELKDKYGDDKQKMSQELMKLYQKEKINPLGGCWPMLIQMPIFIALYWALLESVELRQAPFIFWIQDLSVMDPYFVLPLLMGVSMWFQQKMHPEPPDPMQAKIMKLMPVFMTFLFLFFPSGLVLYWVTNNILSIIQQWYNTQQYNQSG